MGAGVSGVCRCQASCGHAQRGRLAFDARVSIEIEVSYSSPKGRVLRVGWFEGAGRARLVLTGPRDEREEVQINRIEATLAEVVVPVLDDDVPELSDHGLNASLNITVDRRRVSRVVPLTREGSATHQLCAKLVDMGALLATNPGIIAALDILKRHLQHSRPLEVVDTLGPEEKTTVVAAFAPPTQAKS